ncbi:GNAT family N-acetyltransferase [Streptomyces sp. SCSIO 30461]|uniref:GNAT family N-acetyltransferase n=1 Tax=Streptomyces sp. SCSIO 30461 TaxID=3118085 RepID=UPI0030D147CC
MESAKPETGRPERSGRQGKGSGGARVGPRGGARMIPPNIRYAWEHSGNPLVAGAHAWADAVAATRPWLVESRSALAGVPVLAYGGLARGRSHGLPFLEWRRGGRPIRQVSRTSWAELTGGRAAPAAELLVIGVPQRMAPSPPPRHSLLLPFRVGQAVPVGPEYGDVIDRLSRRAREQHRHEMSVRRRSLEVATRESDFDYFYDRMHRPTMDRRHGDRAHSEEREHARRCLFHRGVLFFLCESGRRVAGTLCRLEGRTLVLRLVGVADGDQRYYHTGTYLAVYVLLLQWATAQGLRRVDLAGCEPFLSKGIFQFKRRMHPQVGLPDDHYRDKRMLLWVRRDTPAVRDFLVANPVLLIGLDQSLEACYFHDADRPPRLDLPWRSPGVRAHRLLDCDRFLEGLPGPA